MLLTCIVSIASIAYSEVSDSVFFIDSDVVIYFTTQMRNDFRVRQCFIDVSMFITEHPLFSV